MTLSTATSDHGPITEVTIGPDVLKGEKPQILVKADCWQATDPIAGGAAGYSLFSCAVIPGFEFSGFTLAERGWYPGK